MDFLLILGAFLCCLVVALLSRDRPVVGVLGTLAAAIVLLVYLAGAIVARDGAQSAVYKATSARAELLK